MKTILTSFALCLLLVPALVAQDKPTLPFYGNETCPVMTGKKVNKRWAVEHKGQKIYTCCRRCWKKVKTSPEQYAEKAYPKAKVKKINSKVCPLMGKPIKGGGHKVTWQGHELTMCCKGCVNGFLKEPSKHLTLILNKDIKDAKNKICPIMPEEEVVPDLYYVYKKTLISICCDSCLDEAKEEPEKFLKMVTKKKK